MKYYPSLGKGILIVLNRLSQPGFHQRIHTSAKLRRADRGYFSAKATARCVDAGLALVSMRKTAQRDAIMSE
jgi:hypothetical protein